MNAKKDTLREIAEKARMEAATRVTLQEQKTAEELRLAAAKQQREMALSLQCAQFRPTTVARIREMAIETSEILRENTAQPTFPAITVTRPLILGKFHRTKTVMESGWLVGRRDVFGSVNTYTVRGDEMRDQSYDLYGIVLTPTGILHSIKKSGSVYVDKSSRGIPSFNEPVYTGVATDIDVVPDTEVDLSQTALKQPVIEKWHQVFAQLISNSINPQV